MMDDLPEDVIWIIDALKLVAFTLSGVLLLSGIVCAVLVEFWL